MSGAKNLTPLLVRVRDAGLTVAVDGEALEVSPASKLTPELRAELIAHKPELLELLTWRESVAHKLIQDAMAYLSEFYHEAGRPPCDLVGLDPFEDAIDEAFRQRGMFALRIAVRSWVQGGVSMFNEQPKRGAAA